MSSFRSDRASQKPYTRPANDGQWLHDRAPSGPRADRSRLGVSGHPNSALLVSNLHYEITPKDLISIFGQIGTLSREPLIRYDNSGRSLGAAVVSFETTAEATKAKKQFDGILAKGQPMQITYDSPPPPRHPRDRATSAPTSLLNRVQKPALLERLSHDDIDLKTPSGPRSAGPIRNRGVRTGTQSRSFASSRPPSKPTSGKPNSRAGGKKAPPKVKTADELDQELDAFMGDSETASGPAPAAAADVEMV